MTQQNGSNFSLNINLCVNNLSHLSFGPVGANVRFFSWIYSNKKRYERISEYIRIKKMIRTNIRIYSYQKNNTNEYLNIFASKNDTNMIRMNIRIGKYSNIRIFATPWYIHCSQNFLCLCLCLCCHRMIDDIVLFSAIYHMSDLIWSWDDLRL